jgi:enoyl-CoA hydratase
MSGDVLIRQQGGLGRITLARPSALHALNLEMCSAILGAVTDWSADPSVKLVWIDHEAGSRGFFRTEYRMNAALEAFPKPILAVIDGVTMGGGVGLSVHGSHRVATERTVFAMPETGIGLFPDVGGGWFLPRLPGELGTWLALTGARLKGADVAAARVATHFLPSELVPALAKQIESADFGEGGAQLLNEMLGRLTHRVPAGSFEANRPVIDRCFAFNTAEEIVAALETEGSDWARGEAATLRSKSPETVKVALRQLREGREADSFEDNMRMEFRIGWRKVQSADFLEGVRAVIIDKDNAPVWAPARFEDVSAADVDRYFAPLGADELTFGDGA